MSTTPAPKKDHPALWGVLAGVTILMAVTDYHQLVVVAWWIVLVWAIAANPSFRALLDAREKERQAEKQAKREAKRTQHIYHHYENGPQGPPVTPPERRAPDA